jgi:hypothetical protein
MLMSVVHAGYNDGGGGMSPEMYELKYRSKAPLSRFLAQK